jgi:UDP-N-acetylglucosamine 4,6-dehydratase/5-epimerase
MSAYALIGGTGTLGRALAEKLSSTNSKIRVIARGEHRLNEMRRVYDAIQFSFITCDVRDRDRLTRALKDVDYVIHMAALKHVYTCEYDVIEAVRTNIDGTYNVVNACIDANVKRAVLVSTDKAVEPTTTYGATKLVAERIFVHGNHATGTSVTPSFHCVRYGNVIGSQGSVVPIWRELADRGQCIPIVDAHMTRFWWTVEDAAKFVLASFNRARRGDILVPRLMSCSLEQLAELIAPGAEHIHIAGHVYEKMHETLIGATELSRCTHIDEFTLRVSMFLAPPMNEKAFLQSSTSCDCTDIVGVAKCLSEQ